MGSEMCIRDSFGIDVIREQQLMVSGEDVFFKDIAEDKWASLSTLTVPSEVCVPARTIMKVNVQARDLKGRVLPVGTPGVSTMAHDLGVWETIAECDWHGHVVAVLVNTSEKDKLFRTGEMVGFFDPVDRKDIVADCDIEALFDSFASEPKEKGGEYVPPKMTIEEKDFLTSTVNIAAPSEWKAKYMAIWMLLLLSMTFARRGSLILVGQMSSSIKFL